MMTTTAAGLPDLVSADFNVSLFVQSSAGTFAAPISLYSGGANWVALGDLNGDGVLDVVSNRVTFPMQGGISTTHPGVLLQSATTPGTFGALQDLA